jgi:3-oxoacyl-[acyl-carrier-protein] synthase-3
MDGNAIMLLALNEASKCIKDLKDKYSISEETIDFYIFHQAQKLIVDGVVDQCGIDPEKALRSYRDYGNTSTATLPVTLSIYADRIKQKERVRMILSGFGVGLTWNAALIDLDTDVLFPLIETDYSYNDLPN